MDQNKRNEEREFYCWNSPERRNKMNQCDAGRDKMVTQLLSFGADVAGQSTELAQLVAERLACVTPPKPPEVAKEVKEEVPTFPPLLNELQSYFKQIKTSLDKIKGEIHRMEI